MNHQATFNLWLVLESLTLQQAEEPQAAHASEPVYAVDLNGDSPLPWVNPRHAGKTLKAGHAWAYVAQCGIFDGSALYSLALQRMTSAETPAQTQRQMTRLFDLAFDDRGLPLAQSFCLSLGPWAAGHLCLEEGSVQSLLAGGVQPLVGLQSGPQKVSSSGFDGYEAIQAAVQQWLRDEHQRMRDANVAADSNWLASLVEIVVQQTGVPRALLGTPLASRIKALQQRGPGGREPDALGSFFVHDLRRLSQIGRSQDLGRALAQFMQAKEPRSSARCDVRDAQSQDALAAALHPKSMPLGCWPANGALVFSQQLAVNAAWAQLRDGEGLFAVNGPPGTGKTTMLRDIVAAVVTQRAAVLADLDRKGLDAFGGKQHIRIGDVHAPFYPLHQRLLGHSIMVASSNNGAVENISRELPEIHAVPPRVAQSSAYYPDIATNVIGKPAWGLLAAPLGKSANRVEFLNAFWWGKSRGEAAEVEQATGLRERLKSLQSNPQATHDAWRASLQAFKKARAVEAKERKAMQAAADRPANIAALATSRAQLQSHTHSANQHGRQQLQLRSRLEEQIKACSAQLRKLHQEREQLMRDCQEHETSKPSWLAWLRTLGRSHQRWQARAVLLQRQQLQTQAAAAPIVQQSQTLAHQFQQVETRLHAIAHQLGQLVEQLGALHEQLQRQQEQMSEEVQQLGDAWTRVGAPDDERERQRPWASASWLQARQAVFLAALDVHKAFIEHHAQKIVANLGLASDWLAGKPMPHQQAQLALESLCLVVPVLSTTFASMPRMGANLGPQSIGWLLIDEAGQALPPHAAGALWRARRAVVVGDPLQLEPVMTVPGEVEAAIAQQLNVPMQMWPSAASAQSLADRASRLGTWVPGGAGQAVWVGCPLRLHRRCDEPMFSISNAIAYGGQMVHGKTQGGGALPASSWFDVDGKNAIGHWLQEEGVRLARVLQDLVVQGQVQSQQIALISPFRDVAKQLRQIGRQFGLDATKVGTVHTAQGKEADVVVLVLGGDPQSPGAKAWAAAKPNLLNVAVSRAKKRLYVIGSHALWSRQPHFMELAAQLPLVTRYETNLSSEE